MYVYHRVGVACTDFARIHSACFCVTRRVLQRFDEAWLFLDLYIRSDRRVQILTSPAPALEGDQSVFAEGECLWVL